MERSDGRLSDIPAALKWWEMNDFRQILKVHGVTFTPFSPRDSLRSKNSLWRATTKKHRLRSACPVFPPLTFFLSSCPTINSGLIWFSSPLMSRSERLWEARWGNHAWRRHVTQAGWRTGAGWRDAESGGRWTTLNVIMWPCEGWWNGHDRDAEADGRRVWSGRGWFSSPGRRSYLRWCRRATGMQPLVGTKTSSRRETLVITVVAALLPCQLFQK